MRTRPTKRCALCLQTTVLCDSHLFPAAGYRVLVKLGTQGVGSPLHLGIKIPGTTSSRQIKDYLLCEGCEQKIREGGEHWATANCYNANNSFPLRDAIFNVQKPTTLPDDTSIYLTQGIPGVEVDQLVYFCLSVFWRAAVHTWRLNRDIVHIELGPYAEALRSYLYAGVALPQEICLWVRLATLPHFAKVIALPASKKHGAFHSHHFSYLGLAAALFVGKHIPQETIDRSMFPAGVLISNPHFDFHQLEMVQSHILRMKAEKGP